MKTEQQDFWKGEFGKEYTDRNSHDRDQWRKFYMDNWGNTKDKMNEKCFGTELSTESKILEVGCNTGMQLRCLQDMGYSHIYGVELQQYAVEEAKKYTNNINIIQGSGFDLPFRDGFFDMVCTNGVLIHIAPKDHHKIMDEMYRTSAKYICGFEYYSEKTTDINYRGNKGFLWKADFAQIFMDRFPDLKLVNKEMYPYISDQEKGNTDYMYCLEKTT